MTTRKGVTGDLSGIQMKNLDAPELNSMFLHTLRWIC